MAVSSVMDETMAEVEEKMKKQRAIQAKKVFVLVSFSLWMIS